MFLFTKLIVTLISITTLGIECESNFHKIEIRRFKKKVNVTVFEGEDNLLRCLEESYHYNPFYITWNYGKDLESLERIDGELKEITYNYPLDRVSKDQAGFYTCKFEKGKKPGWEKLFNLTVKGKFLQTKNNNTKTLFAFT